MNQTYHIESPVQPCLLDGFSSFIRTKTIAIHYLAAHVLVSETVSSLEDII